MASAIKLSPDASTNTLDSAIRSQSPIVLESAAFPNVTINGFLISGNETALLMEVTGRPALDPAKLEGAQCTVQMYTDRRYQFSANVSAVPQWGGSYSIALDRPGVLRVLDRRRFLRANLAPSSKVTLDWPDAGGRHSQSANLLNISADGMACRIKDSVAVSIEKRTRLKATFEMPGRGEPFELEAIVSNKTPASEGCTILGLQFVTARRDARAISELRIAIQGGQTAALPVEVCA